MRGVVRSTSRFTVTLGVMSVLALQLSTGPARAATTPVTAGRDSSGHFYIVGPASLIKRFCPPHSEPGFVCLFTGLGETGTGAAIYRGDNAPDSQCDDITLPIVFHNVANDTNKAIEVGDGTCLHRGPIIDPDVEPGVDAPLYQGGDIHILNKGV